eukprot:TRINITY_DN1471_c0_g1_i3.p1 TRINITY_DN1471_c0_g1~~TRINITY_DN1471_c0_g1_i3.p1  ORF type:complete len:478 (-),score=74.94 TRINITY_DN1471_c0_g1_i3:534-1967(-)
MDLFLNHPSIFRPTSEIIQPPSPEERSENGSRQRRRPRNDTANRDFTCGCGKSYLSYPALYTHVKTKHDGKFPEGTVNPNQGSKTKLRGPFEQVELDSKDEASGIDDTMKEIIHFLEPLGVLQDSVLRKRRMVKVDDSLSSSDPNSSSSTVYCPLREFPVLIMDPDEEVCHMLKYLEKMIFEKNGNQPRGGDTDLTYNIFGIKGVLQFNSATNNMIDKVSSETDNSSNSTVRDVCCNKIFANFLYNISQYVVSEFYQEVCCFIMMYRKCLNELGSVKKQDSIDDDTKLDGAVQSFTRDYCENNNGEFLAEICNEFITDFFPVYLAEYERKMRFRWVGVTEDKLKNVINLTLYFCNWVCSNHYSNSRITVNADDNQNILTYMYLLCFTIFNMIYTLSRRLFFLSSVFKYIYSITSLTIFCHIFRTQADSSAIMQNEQRQIYRYQEIEAWQSIGCYFISGFWLQRHCLPSGTSRNWQNL